MNWLFHSEAPVNGVIVPDEDEQRHIRAFRISEGDIVGCTDGKGNLHTCAAHVLKKHTELIVKSTLTFQEPTPFLEIAIAPTKNADRLEWFVEKAVEMGIHKITLIKTEHSERPHLKLDRLNRVAIAAIKQSRKVYLPEITELISFQDWMAHLETSNFEGKKCIAHCADDVQKSLLQHSIHKGENTIIAIGPEGDFSLHEVDVAKRHGFHAVSLGHARLRTETAGMAAVHTFQLINQA